MPMPLPITAFYAGLLAVWIVGLALAVGLARTRHSVSVGDGGVPDLLYRIRAHGNAVETVPIALIVMALAEGFGPPAFVIQVMGVALLVGRLVHGAYFLTGARHMALRGLGTLLTMLVILLGGLGLAGHALVTLLSGAPS